MKLDEATVLALQGKLSEGVFDDYVQKEYNFLKDNGFEDITEEVINKLKKDTKKSAQKILSRIEDSSYYYIWKYNNKIGIQSMWYVTLPEINILNKLTGYEVSGIGNLLSDIGLWEDWCHIKR